MLNSAVGRANGVPPTAFLGLAQPLERRMLWITDSRHREQNYKRARAEDTRRHQRGASTDCLRYGTGER